MGRGELVMVIPEELRAKGWYESGDGLAVRNLLRLGLWRVRVFDGGCGLDLREQRGIELRHDWGPRVRVGLLISPWVRSLVRWQWTWPKSGSGWWVAGLAVDVFAVTLRGWHDDGEASYLT
jgi:hypothetical protein